MVFGEPSAPGAVTVRFVVYVPAVSPASDGVTVSVPPDPETLSHETFSDAVQLNPPAETSTVLAAGLAPPCVPVNDRLDGATVSGGAGGPTVSVTGTVFGEPVAPAAVIVMSVV